MTTPPSRVRSTRSGQASHLIASPLRSPSGPVEERALDVVSNSGNFSWPSARFSPPSEQPVEFEAALEELEALVTRMEEGELPLEEALQQFERGIRLTRHYCLSCQQLKQSTTEFGRSNLTPLSRPKYVGRPVWQDRLLSQPRVRISNRILSSNLPL